MLGCERSKEPNIFLPSNLVIKPYSSGSDTSRGVPRPGEPREPRSRDDKVRNTRGVFEGAGGRRQSSSQTRLGTSHSTAQHSADVSHAAVSLTFRSAHPNRLCHYFLFLPRRGATAQLRRSPTTEPSPADAPLGAAVLPGKGGRIYP
eukprot:502595-Prorocentrum_minimum.AAC.1